MSRAKLQLVPHIKITVGSDISVCFALEGREWLKDVIHFFPCGLLSVAFLLLGISLVCVRLKLKFSFPYSPPSPHAA